MFCKQNKLFERMPRMYEYPYRLSILQWSLAQPEPSVNQDLPSDSVGEHRLKVLCMGEYTILND